MRKKNHALRVQAESWGDKVAGCWRYGHSYNEVSSWRTTEGRQKRPDGGQAKMRAETKPKKTRVDRKEVVRFHWICICLVFRGDPVWFRMIYRDISWYLMICDIISHIIRYHKIRSIEILYPYPERLGLISRYRIPSKFLSISKTIFCPVTCTKFDAPRE